MNIIPCLLGAASQFLIVEEGSDMFSFSPCSPFDHKLKQNSLKVGPRTGEDNSSPACLRLFTGVAMGLQVQCEAE